MIRTLAGFLAGLHLAVEAGPVLPRLSGSVYVFAFPAGGPRMVVDPSVGARISSLSLGGSEALYLNKNQPHWGSTFWPSPQAAWASAAGPTALDRGAYTGGVQGTVLALASAKDGGNQLAFTKRFSADDMDTSITVTLAIRNVGSGARSWAPWQVTRVPPGGLACFPKGPGGIRGNLASQVQEKAGWTWFDMAAATLPGGVAKAFADGVGWMAHVDKDGLLLLETFPDIPSAHAAPGEAEVEIYADPRKLYMEVEHQGAYASIPAGDSTVWTTRWYLRRLPAGIPRAMGDPALMAYVSSLARRATAVGPPRGGHSRITQSPVPARPAVAFPVHGRRPVDVCGRRQP